MTSLATTLTVILAAALLVALLIILIGIVRYARATDQQTRAMNAINETISNATVAIRSGFKTVRRKISHSEELTGQKRHEIIQLVRDSEQRTMDMIRDLSHQLALQGIKLGGTNVNFNGQTNQAQVGDNNKQL